MCQRQKFENWQPRERLKVFAKIKLELYFEASNLPLACLLAHRFSSLYGSNTEAFPCNDGGKEIKNTLGMECGPPAAVQTTDMSEAHFLAGIF